MQSEGYTSFVKVLENILNVPDDFKKNQIL